MDLSWRIVFIVPRSIFGPTSTDGTGGNDEALAEDGAITGAVVATAVGAGEDDDGTGVALAFEELAVAVVVVVVVVEGAVLDWSGGVPGTDEVWGLVGVDEVREVADEEGDGPDKFPAPAPVAFGAGGSDRLPWDAVSLSGCECEGPEEWRLDEDEAAARDPEEDEVASPAP